MLPSLELLVVMVLCNPVVYYQTLLSWIITYRGKRSPANMGQTRCKWAAIATRVLCAADDDDHELHVVFPCMPPLGINSYDDEKLFQCGRAPINTRCCYPLLLLQAHRDSFWFPHLPAHQALPVPHNRRL
jgi:hypothetical protein